MHPLRKVIWVLFTGTANTPNTVRQSIQVGGDGCSKYDRQLHVRVCEFEMAIGGWIPTWNEECCFS